MLSPAAVQHAKPKDKAYKLSDGEGMYLLVNPQGGKYWRLDYRFENKRKTLALGVYPEVTLGAARRARDDARDRISAGFDPAAERKEEKRESDYLFESVAARWLASKAPSIDKRYRDLIQGRLERDILPKLGKRPIGEIEPPDLLEAIRAIQARGALDAGRRIKNYCSDIFSYGIAEGICTRNPAADIRKALKSMPPAKRRPSIVYQNMGRFMAQLEDSDDTTLTKLAMRLTILTWVRTDETRFADFVEFEGLDTANPVWRLSADRMKMDKEHLVPLSKQAVAVIGRIRAMGREEGKLFGAKTVSGVISNNTMLFALYRLGYHSRATMHGFRSTASTWANEQTRMVGEEEVRLYDSDWIERQLAHVEGNAVRGAYNAAEYLPQRRRMLQSWADWLDAQTETARMIG